MSPKLSYDESNPTYLVSIGEPETKIIFPKKITRIVDGDETQTPFISCRSIVTEVSFEEGSLVEYIGKYCFANTTALTKANLSNCLKLQSISHRMFFKSSVQTVILPENGVLKTLYPGSFAYSKIRNLKIPDSVETLDGYSYAYSGVFSSCGYLTKVEISETSKLSFIGTCLAQYSGIQSFFVPKGVLTIQDGAFNLMRSLKTITIDEGNPNYCSIDDVVYSKNKSILKCCACNKQTPIVLEKEVTQIAVDSLRGCMISDRFVVPYGVELIYQNTFSYTQFTEIILSPTITSIHYASFLSPAIKSIVIPPSVTKINENAFLSCSYLKKVSFSYPTTTIELDDSAFYDCPKLETIVIPTENMIMDIDKSFESCPKLYKIYYHIRYFPTNHANAGERKLRYFAKIESKSGSDEHVCGDVEVDSFSSYCRLKLYTKQRWSRSPSVSLISLSIIFLS